MKRRFRGRRKKKRPFFILFVILFFLFLFYFFFRYFPKNDEYVSRVIEGSKNGTFSFGNMNDPKVILGSYLKASDKNEVVSREVSRDVLVYLYSTHERESYSDNGISEYHIRPNVLMMDSILKDYLEEYGISTYIEEESVTDILNQHNWAYRYSYDASRIFITNRLKEYPSLKLIIDLHRDSSNLEKTLLESDQKYARILFVIGGEYSHYQDNYQVAQKLSDILNERVPNISRGVYLKKGDGVNGVYNQDLSRNSVLIELGGQYNELEELNNSLVVFASVIASYLGE